MFSKNIRTDTSLNGCDYMIVAWAKLTWIEGNIDNDVIQHVVERYANIS